MRIGGLWLKKTNDNKTYMSGSIQYPGTELNFAVFKNEEKKQENQPDYLIVWSPERKNSNSNNNNGNNNNQGGNNGAPF